MKKIIVNGEIYKNQYIDINAYLIDYKGKCFIVDPGYESDRILLAIKENNLSPVGVLLTHSHLDHISSIDKFNVPVYIYEKEYDLFMYNYNNLYTERGLTKTLDLDKVSINIIKKGDSIPFLDKEILVIPTPGHTVGGVCYLFEEDLYTGDTLFNGSVGRSDLKTGDINALKKSVLYLINTLPENIKVHPGHMLSTTIGNEKLHNPYYNSWK